MQKKSHHQAKWNQNHHKKKVPLRRKPDPKTIQGPPLIQYSDRPGLHQERIFSHKGTERNNNSTQTMSSQSTGYSTCGVQQFSWRSNKAGSVGLPTAVPTLIFSWMSPHATGQAKMFTGSRSGFGRDRLLSQSQLIDMLDGSLVDTRIF